MARTEDALDPAGPVITQKQWQGIKELLEQHVCSCYRWMQMHTKDKDAISACFPYSFLAFSLYLRYHVQGLSFLSH